MLTSTEADVMKDEFKKLSDDDRKDIAAGLEKNGYKITGPIVPKDPAIA